MCCPIPMSCWPSWWAWWYLTGWHTAMGSTLSAAAAHSRSSRPSSQLIRLHVQMLRLRPNGGRNPPYTMQGARLQLVKPASVDS